MTGRAQLEQRHEASERRRAWLRGRAPKLASAVQRLAWAKSSLALTRARLRFGWPDLPEMLPAEGAAHFGASGPRLVIKTPVPAGPAGEGWGDLQLARGLAKGLAKRGFRARIDRCEERARIDEGDAATLVLRGRRLADWRGPRPHLLWWISHPDEVPTSELDCYARIFVASQLVAERLSRRYRSGRVEVLLQAFDAALSTDPGADARWLRYPVFIGNSRFVRRPIVEDGLKAGLPLLVIGRNWEGRIPRLMWRAPGVPNPVALRLYRGAGLVLNDHWPDMARHGFLSNRLFDVVAQGRPVVSDPVPHLTEIFGSAVRSYTTPAELRAEVEDGLGVHLDPDFVQRFRNDHSLDARAEVIARALAGLGVAPL